MNRRQFVLAGLAYPLVRPEYRLQFPRDHGAHPDFRQEWWYLTGWLKTAAGKDLGFQITFFRARPDLVTDNPSRFTPRQVILAHAAIADPSVGRLRHDERAARTALDLAGAREGTTDVWLDDWTLRLEGDTYRSRIVAREFTLDLSFTARGAPVLQGEQGYSRKGRGPGEASHYYSRPHLQVAGKVNGAPVAGTAWLDHEWSSQYMDSGAAGWDWCGINLDDGTGLMAFRMRSKEGATRFAPEGVEFRPLRSWRSPRTGATYPVAFDVRTPRGEFRLEPLMDDQELDARASTGTIYWEGAVRALQGSTPVGRGYLELTGYWQPMKL